MVANTAAAPSGNGKTFEGLASVAINLTIDASLGAGYNGQVIQYTAASVVTFVVTGGLVVHNRYGYTKTSGQDAVMGFLIDPTATILTIWGDGAP